LTCAQRGPDQTPRQRHRRAVRPWQRLGRATRAGAEPRQRLSRDDGVGRVAVVRTTRAGDGIPATPGVEQVLARDVADRATRAGPNPSNATRCQLDSRSAEAARNEGRGGARQRYPTARNTPATDRPRNEGRGRAPATPRVRRQPGAIPVPRATRAGAEPGNAQVSRYLEHDAVLRSTGAGAGPRQHSDPPGLGTTCQRIAPQGPGMSPGNTDQLVQQLGHVAARATRAGAGPRQHRPGSLGRRIRSASRNEGLGQTPATPRLLLFSSPQPRPRNEGRSRTGNIRRQCGRDGRA